MKRFLDDDFLLDTPVAIDLYEKHARPQPIIDYHCHLPPDQIADDHRFQTLTEIWLHGDHYKWRAMRTNGVPERLITGDATDCEKFQAWASTVPDTLRNPLYHWTHLELKLPFGIRTSCSVATRARDVRRLQRAAGRGRTSARRGCSSSTSRSWCAPPTTRPTLSSTTRDTRATRASRPSCFRPCAPTRRSASTTRRPERLARQLEAAVERVHRHVRRRPGRAGQAPRLLPRARLPRCPTTASTASSPSEYTAREAQAIFAKARSRPRR